MAALTLTGESSVNYSGQTFSDNTDDVVRLTSCSNITFNNCIFRSTYGVGLVMNQCSNITVTNCTFEHATGALNGGIYIYQGSGSLRVQGNYCGTVSREAGMKDSARGQFLQTNDCTFPNGLIADNVVIQGTTSGKEDAISLFKTHGTSGNPLIVEHNWIAGRGVNFSGGGILVGEIDGQYLTVRNNTIINPGSVGVGVAGGAHISVTGNKMLNRTYTTGYRDWAMNSVGTYAYKYAGSSICDDITITNNTIDWEWWDGGLPGINGENPTYFPAPPEGATNSTLTPNDTSTDLTYLFDQQPPPAGAGGSGGGGPVAQHDYVLANDTGANFRTDANNALAAIATNNSGTSAPSTTYAYQWWADTTNSILKQRNAANDGWVLRENLSADIVQSKSSTFTLALSDFKRLMLCTATLTINLPAAATAGEGFQFFVRTTTGTTTLDPSSTEQINGATTITVTAGNVARVICDGSAWYTV